MCVCVCVCVAVCACVCVGVDVCACARLMTYMGMGSHLSLDVWNCVGDVCVGGEGSACGCVYGCSLPPFSARAHIVNDVM